MTLLGRAIASVLLAVMVSPVVLAYGPSQALQPRPASCHEHGQQAPSPNPTTYQCCRAGHQFAAVRESVNLRAPFVPVSRVVELTVTLSAEVVCQTQSRPPALGSPGVTALRI
jgi:hypothetical protein